MPRRPFTKRQTNQKDPIYKSKLVHDYVNSIMRDGKKGVALKIVQRALDLVNAHFKKENLLADEIFQKTLGDKREILNLSEGESLPEKKVALVVLHRALDNTRPRVELRANRVAGNTQQTPRAITSQQGERLARSFIKKAAKTRAAGITYQSGDKGMAKLLYLEWIDAYYNRGEAVKMCISVHKAAKSNLANSYANAAMTEEALK